MMNGDDHPSTGLRALWSRLPDWLRYGLIVGGLATGANGAAMTLGRATDSGLVLLASAAAVTAVLFACGMIVALRAEPDAVVRETEVGLSFEGRRQTGLILILAGVLAAICIAGIVLLAFAMPPGEGRSTAGMVGMGLGFLSLGLVVPLLVIGGAVALGYVLSPVGIRASYRLILDGPADDALARRADLDAFPGLVQGFKRPVLRTNGSSAAVYDIAPESPLLRLFGASMVAAVRDEAPDRLTIETVTRSGSAEQIVYCAARDGAGRVVEISAVCVAGGRLGSYAGARIGNRCLRDGPWWGRGRGPAAVGRDQRACDGGGRDR